MKILISGAGIAGLASAYWLHQSGMDVTVVEKAPELRRGGYMIDFWGLGFDVAEKMGILDELARAHYDIAEFQFVNGKNERVGGFNISKLRKLMNYRHFNLLRSDLEHSLYTRVRDQVEFIFSDSITEIKQDDSGVAVTFQSGSVKNFDLILGADGLHSNVRKLSFGTEEQFEKYLGYYLASFTIDNYLQRDHMFLGYSTPGKQASIYSLRNGKLAAFFVFRSEQELPLSSRTPAESREKLHEIFDHEGWECARLLDQMDEASDFYFDSVSQIRMDRWFDRRIVLVGDAAHCVSLLAGEGAGLAMAGAYILAGELKKKKGELESVFQNYESILKPEILRKQTIAEKFASTFVPQSNLKIWIRNTFTNLMFLPFLSKTFIDRYMSDHVQLPDYRPLEHLREPSVATMKGFHG